MAKDTKRKLGSSESAAFILESRMAVIRQWDKKDAIMSMLPQRIEGGLFYNFKNGVIMSHDGEDCVFHEDATAIEDANRVTDKLLNDLYRPINLYLGSASERTEIEPIEEATDVEVEEYVEVEVELLTAMEILIGEDELKKAKKLLKANPDHDDFKKAKKLLKKAGK